MITFERIGIYIKIILLWTIISFNLTSAISQSQGLKRIYSLDNRSTNFRSVFQNNNTLLIVGQIGRDSFELTGFFVLKIDTTGAIKRVNYFRDPTLTDHAIVNGVSPILLKNNGNLIVAGTMADRNNLFIMEIDSLGNSIMFNEFESDYKSLIVNKVIELFGFYYCIGRVQTQNFDLDVFVHKIDLNGNSVWHKTFGFANFDEGSRAAIVENDGITILSTEGFDPEPLVPNDTERWTRFTHIDTSGSIIWNWISEVNEDEVTSGGFVKLMSEYIYSIWTTYQPNNNSIDLGAQIVKRDSVFNVIWRKDYSEVLGVNGINDITLSHEGDLWAAGQVHNGDLWATIWKIDPFNGEEVWVVQDTGISIQNHGSENYLEGITVLPSGSLIAVGYTENPLSGYAHGLLLKVTKDGCIDTLCTTSLINDILTKINVQFYPNPAVDAVFFHINETFLTARPCVEIFDFNGKRIKFQEMHAGLNAINLEKHIFLPGFYTWNILLKNKRIDNGRFVIVNR